MSPLATTLLGYLPLAIFAGVMIWRLRDMARARPLGLRMLWFMPVLVVILAGVILGSMPVSAWGALLFAVGIGLGALAGAHRARLTRLHIEGEGKSARVMMRQSPAALLLLMAIAGARALLKSVVEAPEVAGTHVSIAGLYVTDAVLGFAVGMIAAHRLGLWRRARALIAAGAKVETVAEVPPSQG